MKKLTIALALSLMAGGSAYAATFVNGGFEDGNLGGWTGGGGEHGHQTRWSLPRVGSSIVMG